MKEENILRILLFLSGLILGHWLAIGRDQRKEFNEIADTVNQKLKKEREGALEKYVWNGPNEAELENLARRVPVWKRRGLTASILNYKKAISSNNYKCDTYGQPFYINEQAVVNAIDDLLSYVHRR